MCVCACAQEVVILFYVLHIHKENVELKEQNGFKCHNILDNIYKSEFVSPTKDTREHQRNGLHVVAKHTQSINKRNHHRV